MPSVTHGFLRKLTKATRRVTQQQLLHWPAGGKFFFQSLDINLEGAPTNGDLRRIRLRMRFKYRRQSNHAFIADDGCRGSAAVFKKVDVGDNGGLRKVRVRNAVSKVVDGLVAGQRH